MVVKVGWMGSGVVLEGSEFIMQRNRGGGCWKTWLGRRGIFLRQAQVGWACDICSVFSLREVWKFIIEVMF